MTPNQQNSLSGENPTKTTRWDDNRYFVNLVLFPLGVLVDIGVALFFAYEPYVLYFTPKGGDGTPARKFGILCIIIAVLLALLYYLFCFAQLFFVELKQKFIAWQVNLCGDEFSLRGYYFKRDSFRNSDVKSVEPYYADKRWFSKEMGTLLTRTRWSNLNYKVQLKDGRIFYLPGEMERVEELKALLADMTARNASLQ